MLVYVQLISSDQYSVAQINVHAPRKYACLPNWRTFLDDVISQKALTTEDLTNPKYWLVNIQRFIKLVFVIIFWKIEE